MMKRLSVDDKIDKNECPERMFCTVATTGMSAQEKERMCLICWLNYCKANDIEVDYGEDCGNADD